MRRDADDGGGAGYSSRGARRLGAGPTATQADNAKLKSNPAARIALALRHPTSITSVHPNTQMRVSHMGCWSTGVTKYSVSTYYSTPPVLEGLRFNATQPMNFSWRQSDIECGALRNSLVPWSARSEITMPAPVIEPPIGSAACNLPIPGERCRKRSCC